MAFEINNSKENIKRRMVKHALNYYDLKAGDEHDLDPIVRLIMEALSLELYNLGNDIADTQVRVLEKIANLLTPDFLTCPNPAHAIMHAMPVEAAENIGENTVFFTQRKIASKNDGESETSIMVHFTPVDNVPLFDAQVAHLVVGNKMYKYDGAFSRQLSQLRDSVTDTNEMWLGLKLNREITSFNNFHFYFDWRNLSPEQAFRTCQLLPLTHWFINNKPIDVIAGLPYKQQARAADTDDFSEPAAQQEQFDQAEEIFSGYNLLSLITKDIKNFYDARFVTINNDGGINIDEIKENYPPAFSNYLSPADLSKFNEKLLWVKVVLPAGIAHEFIEEVNIALNCFPVLNRKLNDKKHRLNKSNSIIPMETTGFDQFLSVHEVTDEGSVYRSVPFRKEMDDDIGTYTLRNGGVERFDNRNAKEFISYLLETLRNESIAFSAFGLDNISTPIKEINQRIALIELKTNSAAGLEVPNYIIVKPREGRELMYVEYWSTLAELANNVRSGSRLQLFAGTRVRSESLTLVTSSTGGRSKLKPEDRLSAFKYGMMTRNRIITKEDIRSFCQYELGNSVKNITIEKGYEMSADVREGFNRTIDIILQPAARSAQTNDEWQTLCQQLKVKLQTRSGMSNNYRVLVKK